MRSVWFRRAAAGALVGAAVAGCDGKPANTAGSAGTAAGTASALATDGPNQVVLSVPGMT